MPIRTQRPYAAKAIVEHDFDTDHLSIWVTFRFPMDQDVKPANALWTVTVDDVDKPIDASTWQDAYTMLLNVPNVAQLPVTVFLAYEGPSPLLVTTWEKQWEPWADILSTGPIGLPYGSFKGNEIMWQQVAAINTWYTITDAGITAGPEYKTTFQTNREILITEAGVYYFGYYITVEISIANKHVKTAPEIDGVEQLMGQQHHLFARANEEESWGGCGLLTLAVDEVASVGIVTVDAGNPTLTVDHIGLALHKLLET